MVGTLQAHPGEWFRIAGSDYCRDQAMHPPGCRCGVRVLTQTAHRIRGRDLGAFASLDGGCLKVVATSAANRPDRRFDVEIKAMFTPGGRC